MKGQAVNALVSVELSHCRDRCCVIVSVKGMRMH